MNRATKTFYKMIQKRIDTLEKLIRVDIVNHAVATTKNFYGFKNILNVEESEIMKEKADRCADEMKKETPYLEFKFLQAFTKCLDATEKGFMWFNYEITQTYLDYFKFNEDMQVSVLVYLINSTRKYYQRISEDLKMQDEETIENIKAALDVIHTTNIKGLDEKQIDEDYHATLRSVCENIDEIIEYSEKLNGLISEDGKLLVNENVKDYFEIIKSICPLILDSQINMILEASLKIAPKNKAEICNSGEEKEVVKIDYKNQKQQMYQAKQYLKQYLDDLKPIKYINAEEMLLITKYLYNLGYSDEIVTKVRKSIIINNAEILKNQEREKINQTKAIYLNDNERSLIDEIEAVLASGNINDVNYGIIKDNYNLLLQLLVNLTDDSENLEDNLFMITMSIEDLTASLEAYKLSNYNFVPKRIDKQGE